jgi:hypothetical protein
VGGTARDPQPSRPGAPASYGIGRDRSEPGERLPWSEVEEWLGRARNYWVATVRPDGRPHAMPVWGVWLDRAVCFSTHPETRKGRNIAHNPEVVVHPDSGNEVAIVEGRAEAIVGGALLDRLVEAYEVKYGIRIEPSKRAKGIYAVRPRLVFAWREADFPDSATRWSFAG